MATYTNQFFTWMFLLGVLGVMLVIAPIIWVMELNYKPVKFHYFGKGYRL